MEINTISSFDDMNQFLSNFAISPVNVFGKTFRTAEHAYQFAKTNDPEWQEEILKARSPGKAKRLGQKCPVKSNWEDIKFEVMEAIVRMKFSNPWFQNQLLQTGDKILVEGNTWHDNYWGDCSCEQCKKNVGKNNLGKILMDIRSAMQPSNKE